MLCCRGCCTVEITTLNPLIPGQTLLLSVEAITIVIWRLESELQGMLCCLMLRTIIFTNFTNSLTLSQAQLDKTDKAGPPLHAPH
jgi:hypothetical protein